MQHHHLNHSGVDGVRGGEGVGGGVFGGDGGGVPLYETGLGVAKNTLGV